jgi:hypothetical protein
MPDIPPIARRSGFRRLLLLGAWLALTVFYFSPVTTVMDTLLDSSNYSSYTYFAAHRFQYGPEVVPMSGPFGYVMYGSVYNGLLFWTRLFAQLVCVGALAALVLWFFGRSRDSAWRWPWLALIVLLSPVIEDLPFEWMILLTGLFLLQRPPDAPAPCWLAPAAALLAFISLIKGTHFVLSAATLAVILAFHVWCRDWRRVLLIAGSYAATFLLFWLLAGQSPRHIPAFIQGIRALTDGYNEAMALDETRGALLRGLLAAGLLAAAYAWGAWHRRQNPVVLAATLLFAGFTFVKWKHGFVRADGHMNIFHHYVMVAAVFWFLLVFALHRREEPRRVRLIATALMLAGFGAGFWIESGPTSVLRMRWLLTTWNVEHLRANLDQLSHPAAAKARFDRLLAEQGEILAMPLTRQQVGDRPIDLFGVQHGIIPLNGMNYRPRPMGGGAFNAYNPYLMRLNREFIRDPARRPDYYLLRFETIDRRLAAQDDGLTLLEILHHYQPLFIERDHLLLKAMPAPVAAEPRHLARRTFQFSEFVPVPKVDDDQLLLARFTIRPSLQGRLRSFLYKAPLMFMTLQGEGIADPESRRFIPAMTATPFLFSPAIEDNPDVAYLYTRQPGKRVTGFFIYSHDPACYAGDLSVEFLTLPRPPVPQSPDIDELLTFTRFPVFNLTPESIQAAESHPMHLRSLLVQTLHAPGEVVWKLDGTEQELVFDYGFLPEAVQRGSSNGAVFIVEARPPGEAPRELFRRLVDPAQRKEDRGNLSARVTLPALSPGTRLALRTDPGEGGNNAWDWCYVTRVQLKRGYFSSARFPVFNREPAAVVPADAGPLELGQDKVFLLHIPGALTFNLRGDEHRVRLEFGFMPGAYTGEGRTEGGDFVIELVRSGQPAREVFRRTLRPLGVPADRGRQSVEVKLPAVMAGDQLFVRTQPLPGAGNSWGWTYFSRLNID